MRVFHGSAVEVTNPEIRTGKFTKDFGEGFYCTKLKRQAKRWAMRKETPTISIYEYATDKNLNILDIGKIQVSDSSDLLRHRSILEMPHIC